VLALVVQERRNLRGLDPVIPKDQTVQIHRFPVAVLQLKLLSAAVVVHQINQPEPLDLAVVELVAPRTQSD
jgi:hypothetical protein